MYSWTACLWYTMGLLSDAIELRDPAFSVSEFVLAFE